MLHKFENTAIDKDCSNLTGVYNNSLFYGCKFNKLNDLQLVKCNLNGSKFDTSSIKDAINFTLTLNCGSFKNVEYSPLLFDLLLYLITISKGNDEKRAKIKEVLGESRYKVLDMVMGAAE